MRQLLLVSALIFGAAVLSTPYPVQAEVVANANYVISGESVRLRAEPNTSAQELGRLALGSAVRPLQKTPTRSTVAGKTTHWYQVKTEQGTGWVFGGFVIPAPSYEMGILELLRNKLKAESIPFANAVVLYQLASKAANSAKSRNAKGELELAKLTTVQRSFDSINFAQYRQSPYREWINKHKKISFYNEVSGQYLVSANAFWKLADQYKRDPIGDEIAWRSSQQRLGGECEGFIGCLSIATLRTEGEYLKRFPKGRYVRAALVNLNNNFKYMLDGWKNPEQNTQDVDLKTWSRILKPIANTPESTKARTYLKQLQAMK
ncbi:SH3 domain-containing protein [Thiofilum flexile]|uniref:SH3 domain-containing protein n=1 Tax=Thiofilum flexile TaxID=125627 RepID=UPI00036E94C0|nr:SH3 domain-containing protein [Thiofilum flexile]